MPAIYLSSTYEDLKDYRQVVFEALRKSGYQVIAMEDYVAADRRPVDQCLKDVEKADLYVGLFAFRYGYVPPVDHGNLKNLSITELEFQHAITCKKPSLTFIAKEDAGIPLKFVDAYTGEGEKGKRIECLRQYLLTQKMAGQFSVPHALANEVLAAVTKHLEDRKQSEPSPPSEPAKLAPVTWNIEQDGSPYPGLLHFTRKYAPVFFGRDAELREILDRLREPEGRFLIISGDSGVGKSSVVDAGLLPTLENGGLPDAQPCQSVRMVPSQRQQPLEALLGALGSLVTQAGLRPDTLLEDLTRAPEKLGAQIKAIMKGSGSSRMLLLFIDQMEELFTAHDVTQANSFLAGLYQAANEQALWVIGTIRSDHLHYCHRHPDMVQVLNGKGHYALGPVKSYMMQDMILKPAQAAGLTITEAFAKRLIHDTGAESANLPLLAFVLDRLFQQRTNHVLSETVYDKLGGVAGAIGAHVKNVEASIERTLGVKTAEVFPGIFHTLAKVQKEEDIPTRNRQKKQDFPPDLHPVIDRLVTERLLRTEGEGEEATVSISHEKLFQAWPALREYVMTHKKVLMDRTLLESRTKKWGTIGKPWFSGLATGREYHDFQQAGVTAGGLTKEFLEASRRARHLWMGGGLVVLLLIGGVIWLWQKGYNLEHASLKVQSLVMSIHVLQEMVPIPGGTYRQGDVEGLGEASSNPVRDVTIQPFAMSKYEVTFEEYDQFVIATNRDHLPNDQRWGRDQRPVINVSWEDAKAYAAWMSEKTGKRYRLPTESEWEYAARSGEKEEVWAGTSDETQLKEYAVYTANSGNRTAEVGEHEGREPNSFGLYDMSGNVWEWVEDCEHYDYQGAPTDGSAWLEGEGGDCTQRVVRGGSWDNTPGALEASHRYMGPTGTRGSTLGFRLAQDIP